MGEPVPHAVQFAPPVPHAAFTVPGTHVEEALQQPPLHVAYGPHALVHTPALHARNGGQSAEVTQPQPPSRHTVPAGLPRQFTQAPAEPQAVFEVPVMHVPAGTPQQEPASHAPKHVAVQRPAEHVGVSPLQATHAVPVAPHAPVDVPGLQ